MFNWREVYNQRSIACREIINQKEVITHTLQEYENQQQRCGWILGFIVDSTFYQNRDREITNCYHKGKILFQHQSAFPFIFTGIQLQPLPIETSKRTLDCIIKSFSYIFECKLLTQLDMILIVSEATLI